MNMRFFTIVGWILSLAVAIVGAALSASRVAAWEDGQYYSMGIASARRLYAFSDECSLWEESKAIVCSEEKNRRGGSLFSEGGSLTLRFREEEPDLSESVERKAQNDDLEYRFFAFSDRLSPLIAPLNEVEVGYVFSRIVSSSTLAVPIEGRLEEITFLKEGSDLTTVARIDLDFSLLKGKYHLEWLPDHALFFLCVPFSVNNSEISVNSEDIFLKCETFDLPEALLIFGCNVAFGKKDYRTLFGEAVKNVFINAGIYR